MKQHANIFVGQTITTQLEKAVSGEMVDIRGERFYKIAHVDAMPSFFMSILSQSNHWMFISSTGGVTAGRQNSDSSLFPYYTDDKVSESAETTGSKTIFRIIGTKGVYLWEPFSERYEGAYKIERNLYKNVYGNKVCFEEKNIDLGLTFTYQWTSSEQFGFVKQSVLTNDAPDAIEVEILDGIQNIMPYGVGEDMQKGFSNLVDAYKKAELESGLGIFALSAIIVDKAEPSEALRATTTWSAGLDNPKYLISSRQLQAFRQGASIEEEVDVRAARGAYFVNSTVNLSAGESKQWVITAEVNQSISDVQQLLSQLKDETALVAAVEADIEAGTTGLIELTANADGLQLTADELGNMRHFSNTMFNIMRGGIFDNNYEIEKADFIPYLEQANAAVVAANQTQLDKLGDVFTLPELKELAEAGDDKDFQRLCLEYLPLKFSRRHGDPSRPWNKFSINTKTDDGKKILDYQGNWRDIFQNWEALAYAYPEFIETMIHKFLNASTFDGYNPYRVTKGGIDWETIEPDDPWSYIGYWGDHQIIYLLKFFEFIEELTPGQLVDSFHKDMFVYANVPYKIKSYADILKNPKDTIDFDHASDLAIQARREEMGADGALLQDQAGQVYKVNMLEKILATVLAKLSNFIAEGGIWMNTQRPEWNDANNALVGNGISMVTLYYIRRFFGFMEGVLADADDQEVAISSELLEFFERIMTTFESHKEWLAGSLNDTQRKELLDGVAQAGSDYRTQIYKDSFSGDKKTLSLQTLKQFVETTIQYLDHSIKANKRADNLYHAYNLVDIKEDGIGVSYLSEMLEGQVAVLSAGSLTPAESLEVLDALKTSALYRPDQNSYILYPNKQLARFVDKNNLPADAVAKSALLKKMLADGCTAVFEQDLNGDVHFSGRFKNANDMVAALDELADSEYAGLIAEDKALLLDTFEGVFNHKEFTGRSGTFFGYEGLGSIYWHMVSKLSLAAQESALAAIRQGADQDTCDKLTQHFYDIKEGIGVHKSPAVYGAFPTDAYSHTPAHRGAQQPGMTGQVKEDILTRIAELGAVIKQGQLTFQPSLLQREEFLTAPATFHYKDVHGELKNVALPTGSLAYTFCQVPVVYILGDEANITVHTVDGKEALVAGNCLDAATSQQIFTRTAAVKQLTVTIIR